MTYAEGSPPQDGQTQVDREMKLGRATRRRVVIAASATVGAAFIAAGLLAGPAFLPGVRDQIHDRDLLPVQIIGGTGFQPAAGIPGSNGADGAGPSRPFESFANEVPDILLPGGQSLRDIVAGAPGPSGAVDGATGLVDDTVDGLTDVLQDPTNAPKFVEDTVDGVKKLVEDTVSTLPLPVPTLPGAPITVPPITVPPITGPPVTVPPVTIPPITVPPVTIPPITVPTLPRVTVPVSGVTVPQINVNPPTVTLPVTLPGL